MSSVHRACPWSWSPAKCWSRSWPTTSARIQRARRGRTRSAGGAYIAYQVFGQGEVDLLWISPWFSHLELLWEHPPVVRFHQEMASFARVIMLDQRGVGLSDRSNGFPDLETRMDDLRAVLDAAGSDRTVLWGAGPDGGALCAMFAATYPDRVAALAFWNASA